MTIYIHGFSGSGEGAKAKLFREYFKDKKEGFIAPSLSYIPELVIKTLEELIESYNSDVTLIGSSLGGYYAIYLSQKYSLKTVLLNPQEAIDKFKDATVIAEEGGSHGFDGIESHFDEISEFLQKRDIN